MELSLELDWPVHRIRSTLDELAKLSLPAPLLGGAGRAAPGPPEVGLSALLAREEAALLAKQQEIERSRTAVAQMIARLRRPEPGALRRGVRVAVGIDMIRTRIEELVAECRQELLGFEPKSARTPDNIAASRPLDEALLDRGAAIRVVYHRQRPQRPADQRVRGLAHRPRRPGAHRSRPSARMLVFDRRMALLPTNPEDSGAGAVLLHGAGVVTALVALFEQTWDPPPPSVRSAGATRRASATQEREVLPPALGGTDRPRRWPAGSTSRSAPCGGSPPT